MKLWLYLLFLCCAVQLRAITYTPYYQSQAVGNDSNNGLTPATAKKTFAWIDNGGAGVTGPAIIYIDSTNAYNGHAGSSYRINYLKCIGASNADVILTNWGTGHWAITNCQSGDGPACQIKGYNWWRIFDMDLSNNVNNAVYLNGCTNFEFGYCNFESNAVGPMCVAFDSSGNSSAPVQQGYIHDCNSSNVLGTLINSCSDASSDLWHVGGGVDSQDQTGGFIFIRDNFYKAGHAWIEMNGPSNRVTGCLGDSSPWQIMTDQTCLTNKIYFGSRGWEPSGVCCSNCILESNTSAYAGYAYDQPASHHWHHATAGIDRFNNIFGASAAGIEVDTLSWASPTGSNSFYHDSVGLCGSNVTFYSTGALIQTLYPYYPEYNQAMVFYGSSNNCVIDCILHHNYLDTVSLPGGGNTFASEFQDWRGVLTNNANPLWVSEANSIDTLNPSPSVYPNFALASAASPAISAYVWPGIITSTGTGTTFQSTNAFMFTAGQMACYFTMPGDTIQTQLGQVTTILSIVGNTVTVSVPITVTNGMGYDIAGANASGAYAFQGATITANATGPSGTLRVNAIGSNATNQWNVQ